MKRWLWIFALCAIAAAGIFYGLRKPPVPVEAAKVKLGPLQETVEEEGKTRLKSRYVVSAPIGGFMRRLKWKVGDRVRSGETVTVLNPMAPAFLDTRTRDQGEARVNAAEASLEVARSRVKTAEEQVRSAQVDLDYWRREKERQQPLVKSGDIPVQKLDEINREIARGEAAVSTAQTSLVTVRQQIMSADAELTAARAALLPSNKASVTPRSQSNDTVPVIAPAGGRVIRIIQESEGVVTPGQPLMEIGDANAIEVEVEVLSPDAVRIMAGTRVLLTGWGGDEALEARVRVVEPGGFTKISALGVEEQRVRVVADITSPEEMWRKLGDGYRVDASFVLWESDKVLQIPANALFRYQDGWAVFVIEDGVARRRAVEVGHRTGLAAEILSGLKDGETVIAHPDETVEDGFPVAVT